MKAYQDINKETIDRWVEEGWEWSRPVSHEEYLQAKHGNWNVLLTPTVFVPHEWFGNLKGKKILGLASGGEQQMASMLLTYASNIFLSTAPAKTIHSVVPSRRMEDKTVTASQCPWGAAS